MEEKQLLKQKGADPRKGRERIWGREKQQVSTASHPWPASVCDSICMKCLEEANEQTQKVDRWLLGAGGRRNGEWLLTGVGFLLVGDDSVLELV